MQGANATSALARYILGSDSRATVMTAEISNDPKQPRRFEKKKNISTKTDA
jgi:hypothetical protein